MNIFIGNLPIDAHETDVRQMIESYGKVTSLSLHEDEFSKKPRKIAFAEMFLDNAAQTAIGALDGTYLKGLAMRVFKADYP